MNSIEFERAYTPIWDELEDALLGPMAERRGAAGGDAAPLPWWRRWGRTAVPAVREAARLTDLYRRSCEHLALAQDRAYPPHLIHRLERLTERAHARIYARGSDGTGRLKRLALVEFPQAVRAHAPYVWTALALFAVPLLLMAWACWRDPGFILHLMDAREARMFDQMYGDERRSIGAREASDDWMMLGHYVHNNIGIAFQVFASGLFVGVGTIFFTVYNGLIIGAACGYLVAQGLSHNFFPFVVTHGAFELTAIVLASAAGLRLGHALLAPGRLSRTQALQRAASQVIVIIYGAAAMLLVAAFIEAFWSSSRWIPPVVKYVVGGACWTLVLAYLGFQGRARRPEEARP